jgi:FKBP-type peptidyl-prolyl cis-trans isomerase 2
MKLFKPLVPITFLMQKGDFIRINYVGKIKESGEIFDKGENIPIVVGEGFVIRGLDEEIEKMQVGEKQTVEIPPEKAFGERDAKLVKLIPLSEFKRHNMNPYPGMVINANGIYGKVLSVSSGRVRVDFNHPLAGKILEYEVEIKEKIEKQEEKAKALIEFYSGEKDTEIKFDENGVEIILKKAFDEVVKRRISESMKKFLGVKEVKFSEIY